MPAVRRLVIPILLVLAGALAGTAGAQTGSAVDVVVVNGPIDGRRIDFVVGAITDSHAGLVVLQMDVRAVLSADVDDLIAVLADAPVPVAVWVGPAPAVARGAAVEVLEAAPLRGAAPGVVIGPVTPRLAGGPPPDMAPLTDGRGVVVDGPIPGLVDFVEPSIGQFVVGLDGASVTVRGVPTVLETATPDVDDAGVPVLRPSGPVRFVEEGVVDRVLHAMATPEAAFFFLLVGLAFAAFEFYAAGPGVAAGVAVVALLLAGYGMGVMPMWWPAVGAVLAGILLYLVEFQRNDLGWRSVLGTGLLLFGGLRFVDGGPWYRPSWWVVLMIVAGTGLFFAFALTTVVRARFSTQTIGRGHLLGRRGVAVGPIAPDGEVEVDGARWRARSTRQSGITAGDAVVVVRIDGIVLEVDPAPPT